MTHARTALAIALMGTLGASGCGGLSQSRLNPLNLFSSSEEVAVTTTVVEGAEFTDSRGLIDQILTLETAQTTSGIIVRATGIADRQGDWNAELVRVPSDTPARLTLAFVAADGGKFGASTPERSREVTVATRFSDKELAGIREINVTAARNARAIRR